MSICLESVTSSTVFYRELSLKNMPGEARKLHKKREKKKKKKKII